MAFFDDTVRSASVIASEPAKLLVIPIAQLSQFNKQSFLTNLFEQNPSLLIARNAAKNLSRRVRAVNEIVVEGLKKELAQAQLRQAMSMLIITTLVLFSLYVFVVQALSHLRSFVFSSTFLSVPLLISFMLPVGYVIKHSGYPLSMYGLTLKDWRRKTIQAIEYTIPVLILIVICKWILLIIVPGFADRSLFEFSNEIGEYNNLFAGRQFLPLLLYAMFIPIQEFLVRGVMQSSFQMMLVGRYRLFWSILLANLIFSASHVYISIWLGFIVFLPGLFWGWLYSKQKSIIGVSVSHFIVGLWAFYVVGIG